MATGRTSQTFLGVRLTIGLTAAALGALALLALVASVRVGIA